MDDRPTLEMAEKVIREILTKYADDFPFMGVSPLVCEIVDGLLAEGCLPVCSASLEEAESLE
jgi:hypothetical protein